MAKGEGRKAEGEQPKENGDYRSVAWVNDETRILLRRRITMKFRHATRPTIPRAFS